MKIHSPVLINYDELTLSLVGPVEPGPSIQPGNFVKVSDVADFEECEGFWLKVTKCDGKGLFVGRVESYLLADKPYGFGDLIRFGAENVYDLWQEPDEQLPRFDFPAREGEP